MPSTEALQNPGSGSFLVSEPAFAGVAHLSLIDQILDLMPQTLTAIGVMTLRLVEVTVNLQVKVRWDWIRKRPWLQRFQQVLLHQLLQHSRQRCTKVRKFP